MKRKPKNANSKTAPSCLLRQVYHELSEDEDYTPRIASPVSTTSPSSVASDDDDEDLVPSLPTDSRGSGISVSENQISDATPPSTLDSPAMSQATPVSSWDSPVLTHAILGNQPQPVLQMVVQLACAMPAVGSACGPCADAAGMVAMASPIPGAPCADLPGAPCSAASRTACCQEQPQNPAAPSKANALQHSGNQSFQLSRQRPRTVATTYNKDREVFQIVWTCDARKLRSQDRQIVSPCFSIQLNSNCSEATFRMMLIAKELNSLEGSSSFQKTKGRGIVQLKCEADARELPQVKFAISTGIGKRLKKQRGPVQHCFAQCAVAGLPREEQEWDFHSVIDYVSKTFVVSLEIAASS